MSKDPGFVALPRSGSLHDLSSSVSEMHSDLLPQLAELKKKLGHSQVLAYTEHLIEAARLADPDWYAYGGSSSPGGSSPGGSSPGGSSPGGSSPGGTRRREVSAGGSFPGGSSPGGSSPGGSSPGGSSPGGTRLREASPGGSSPGGSSPGGSSPGGSSPGGSSPREQSWDPARRYATDLQEIGSLMENAVASLRREATRADIDLAAVVRLQESAGQLAALRPEAFHDGEGMKATSPFENRGRPMAPRRADTP